MILGVEGSVADAIAAPLRRRLARRARRMLQALGLRDAELSLLLAGDDTVATLNADYRGRRGTTDVLSFSQADPEDLRDWMARPRRTKGSPERMLGDLVISVDVVRRRSPGPKRFEADLVDLMAHGVLHLVGWSHAGAATRRRMLDLQAALRDTATSRGPVTMVDALDALDTQ